MISFYANFLHRTFNILILFTLLITSTILHAQDKCIAVGWATTNGGVTGGGNTRPVIVTTLADLTKEAASAASKVIYIKGTIGDGVATRVKVSSNKTIFGLPGATLIGGIDVKAVNNVIIRNLILKGPGAVDVDGVDCITVDKSTNVWLDHLDVSDGQDGNLDVVNGSNYVTITWTKFHYSSASKNHMFSNLFGNSDSKTTDRGKIKVTMQYNWYTTGVLERMPRVRFGQVHIVNNLFAAQGNGQCVRAGLEADLLIEGNVFIGVNKPIDLYENNFTAVTARNNIFKNTTGNTDGKGNSFVPPYSLAIIPATEIEKIVKEGAGATLKNEQCTNTITNVSEMEDTQLNINPNPFSEEVSISTSSKIVEMTVMDLDGKVIITEKGNLQTHTFGQSLQPGCYILNIKFENGLEKVVKLLKSK